MLTAKVASLTEDLNTKDNEIDELVKRVNTLEEAADAVEQYSRRPNLRFHGADGEDTDAKVVHIVNDVMKLQPPMLVDHLARSLRLGPRAEKDGRPRQRAIIARFRSERLRDAVFKARFALKAHNAEHRRQNLHK